MAEQARLEQARLRTGEAAHVDRQVPHCFGSTRSGSDAVLGRCGQPGERMLVRAALVDVHASHPGRHLA